MTTALSAREVMLLAEIARLKRSLRSYAGWGTRRKRAAQSAKPPADQRHALLDDLARINPEVAARVARKLGVLA